MRLADAHEALADAEATAALLTEYRRRSATWTGWDRLQEFSEVFAWPAPPRRAVAPVLRGTTSAGSEVLASVVGKFARVEGVQGADEYLDLLDRVLLDRKISEPERRALEGMAASLGLGAADVARLNRHYLLGAVDAVCADDQLTREERALVIRLAGLLDLRDLEVEALLARAEVAEARGLVVWPAVKRGVVAVIAQDPGSGSGKARKAREYGIPVVREGILG